MSDRITLSLDGLQMLERAEEFVPLNADGSGVLLREPTADELVWCYRSAMEEDPQSGVVRFNASLFEMCKVAVCMAEPSLGMTPVEKLSNLQVLKDMPTRPYQALKAKVDELTQLDMDKVRSMAQVIESVPALWSILRVLSEKRGWLEDLDGKTLQEVRVWMAFYEALDQRTAQIAESLAPKV